MTDIYRGGQKSSKRMTRREWKEYLRKMRASYKKGERIKQKTQEQHERDVQEADASLEKNLEDI